jgi:hypothetical protein
VINAKTLPLTEMKRRGSLKRSKQDQDHYIFKLTDEETRGKNKEIPTAERPSSSMDGVGSEKASRVLGITDQLVGFIFFNSIKNISQINIISIKFNKQITQK